MTPAKHRPRHDPGCVCSVCWTAQFCADMHKRNDERLERSRRVYEKPYRRGDKFWSLERRAKGTPYVPMLR